MKEIVEVIARAIVDEPHFVYGTQSGGIQTSRLELQVANTDIGKVSVKHSRSE